MQQEHNTSVGGFLRVQTGNGSIATLAKLISNWRKAEKEFTSSINANNAAEEAFNALNARCPILSPAIAGVAYEMMPSSGYDGSLERISEKIDCAASNLRAAIELLDRDTAIVDEWESVIRSGIQVAVQQLEARRTECGLTDASAALCAASDAEATALHEVLAYRPKSSEEARAKVAFLGQLNRSRRFEGCADCFDGLLESILPEGEGLPDECRHWSFGRATAA